jgi:ribosome biogenesis protein BMS1
VHGFPKVMGVLTHLDGFRDNKRLKKTKKALKHRFWAEIYQGAHTTSCNQHRVKK